MDYAALGVGLGEVALGVATLRKAAAKHHIPLLSANLLLSTTKAPAFQATLVRQVGPLKIGLFGLTSIETAKGPRWPAVLADEGLIVASPDQAAKTAVAALRAQQCDLIVVLTQLTRTELNNLLEKVPGIDLALGSAGQEMSNQLSAVGKSHFADAFQKGKYVGMVTVNVRADRKHYFAEHERDAATGERAQLAQQLMNLQKQLDPPAPGQPPLGPPARQALERQVAVARAKLQQATLQIEAEPEAPKDASTLELTMTALSADIEEDGPIADAVKALHDKFPKGPGH